MTPEFRRFLDSHPSYGALYDSLLRSKRPDRAGRLLALCVETLFQSHGEALGEAAEEICSFLQLHYSADYVERYCDRVSALAALQRRFDQNPCVENLGDPAARVAADDYNLALLLSIILTPHRFAIMEHLSSFLHAQALRRSVGRLAAIGIGSGHELVRAARLLPGWDVEGYDLDEAMCNRARQLWKFCRISKRVEFGKEFPLEKADAGCFQRYDSLIMCELCEHLDDPLRALTNTARYLKRDGQAFVTMALNIAQEDHVFLYPTAEACRSQLAHSGLRVIEEWMVSQSLFGVPEQGLWKGNYVAVVSRRDSAG